MLTKDKVTKDNHDHFIKMSSQEESSCVKQAFKAESHKSLLLPGCVMKYMDATRAHLTGPWAICLSTWSPEVTNPGCFPWMFNHLLPPLFLPYLPLLIERNKSIWCCGKHLAAECYLYHGKFFPHFFRPSPIYNLNALVFLGLLRLILTLLRLREIRRYSICFLCTLNPI